MVVFRIFVILFVSTTFGHNLHRIEPKICGCERRPPVRSGRDRLTRPPGRTASIRPEIGLFVNSAARNSFSQSD